MQIKSIYKNFIKKAMNGVITAVIIPTVISDKVLITICFCLPVSMHFEVPITWLAAPIASPIAISCLTFISFKILCPARPPKTPVNATMHTVSSGTALSRFEISVAMGAVTDFGSIDKIIFNSVRQAIPMISVVKSAQTTAIANAG